MPQVDEIVENKKEIFKKKKYRLWNLSGTTKTEEIISQIPPSPILNNHEIEKSEVNKTVNTTVNVTVNKRATNGKRNGKQTVNKRATNGKQTVNKRATNGKHNGKQTVNTTVNTFSHFDLSALCGLQLKIMLVLYENCKLNNSLITSNISLGYISKMTDITKKSVKTILYRLRKKGYIKLISSKDGRGGWTRHQMNEFIYKSLSFVDNGKHNSKHNGKQIATSSSSNNILNTTTNWDEQILDSIDISPLEKIKFTKSHLKQFCTVKDLTPEIIQHSINHFAYDLKHNAKEKEIKKSPLAYFMGIMKRNGCYNSPDNYESPQDKAIREWVEKEEKQKKLREEQRIKVFNLAFDKWLDSLTEEEARKIFHNENPKSRIPFKGKGDSGFSQAMLRNYYRKKIWINERKELGLDGFWDHFNEDSLANATNE